MEHANLCVVVINANIRNKRANMKAIKKLEIDRTESPVKIYIDGERLDLSNVVSMNIVLDVDRMTVHIVKNEVMVFGDE